MRLPVEVITVSPGEEKRIVTEFRIIPKCHLYHNAGWREREIIDHATTWDQEGRLLTLNTEDTGVTASGTVELGSYQWVA